MLLKSLFSQQPIIGSQSSPNSDISNVRNSSSLPVISSCRGSFCCDPEGWGPISEVASDFTPCFISVLGCWVAACGIVFGGGSIMWVVKRRHASQASISWQFRTKMGVIAALVFTNIVQLTFQIVDRPQSCLDDLRIWASIFTTASFAVVGCVQYLEHARIQNTGAVVVLYWLFTFLIYATQLRSSVLRRTYEKSLPHFIAMCGSFALVSVEFALVWLSPKRKASDPSGDYGDRSECPSERASIFSILTFSWMTPMMKYGYKNYVTDDDLWDLAERDSARAASGRFQDAWNLQREHRKDPSLWVALVRGFGAEYTQGVLFRTGADVFALLQPQLLRLLTSFVGSYRGTEPQPITRGTAIAFGMFIVSIAHSLCLHQCFQRISQIGIRLKSSLISGVYMKSLRLSNGARAAKSTGDIVNLMAVDCQRVQDASQFGQHLWSAPFQIILCLASLYQLLGYSMFSGIVIIVFMIPLNGLITTVLKNLQKRQMKNKDARSRIIAEVLSIMKSIKLFAWGEVFMEKIRKIRNDRELATLRKIGTVQAISSFTGSVAPFLVACSTFAVYVLVQKKPLTTEIVFPALTLFHLLASPLAVLPAAVSAGAEASIAVGRLKEFLAADELQEDAVTRKEAVTEIGQGSVILRDATFTWDNHDSKSALEHINFSARSGELCCLVGRVGAGKSSFIQAILGDLYKVNGLVTVHGSTAYAAQQPWVLNASVQDNITFGHPWDPDFYEETVHACALVDDFTELPNGDRTVVGDRGISLSGGQKARLTLARAVYSRADVYLLDDCLAAVDQHVGRHLIDNVLGPKGLLSQKTRILATNSIPAMMIADNLVLIRDGKIWKTGTYERLKNAGGEFAGFINKAGNSNHNDIENQFHSDGTNAAKNASPSGQNKRPSGVTSTAHLDDSKPRPIVEATAMRTKVQKESPRQGGVSWNIYGDYAKASNLPALAVYIVALLCAQTTELGSSFWLKQWSESNDKSGSNSHVRKYIGVYAAFGIGSASLVLAQNLVIFLFSGFAAARSLHERMMFAIFRSPMTFLETTPAGRILNRLTSDMYRIDEGLPRQFNQLFATITKILFILAVISAGTPIFIVLIIPLASVYIFMQRYFLKTKRELKRLDSTSRGPVFAHFQESLGGIATIRGYGQQNRFSLENEERLDANMRAYFPSISANRWLGVRLEFLGSIIISSAAGFAIMSVSMGSGLPEGMVGLAVSYALQITQLFNALVRLTGEVETNIVAVERVLEYTQLPSEGSDIINSHRPAANWPANGTISFVNYSTRYRPELNLVLRNIILDIKKQEKIGVVGRTGAGKSSFALALFRLIEAANGSIHIDNLDISTVGLRDLRGSLTVIPQDAALFEGTVRENLDPGQIHDDTDLWIALDLAQLKKHVASMQGGLDAKVYEGGSNLSQGQKQLVSLARALLSSSSILVLDEATAAVDIETDGLLQETLRKSFGNRTIITIAHRINTIIDYDRVIVLDKGRVVEFDTPAALMVKKGAFYKLAKETGPT